LLIFRGPSYGTLIVNLETHHLIDVLPDRTVATVTAWLAAHPEIEVISRDRDCSVKLNLSPVFVYVL
jgi:transposase